MINCILEEIPQRFFNFFIYLENRKQRYTFKFGEQKDLNADCIYAGNR